jgi:hypothetical protein
LSWNRKKIILSWEITLSLICCDCLFYLIQKKNLNLRFQWKLIILFFFIIILRRSLKLNVLIQFSVLYRILNESNFIEFLKNEHASAWIILLFSLSYGWTNAHFERTWCVVRTTFDIYLFIVIITGRIIHALACSFFRNSIKLLSFKILYNTLNLAVIIESVVISLQSQHIKDNVISHDKMIFLRFQDNLLRYVMSSFKKIRKPTKICFVFKPGIKSLSISVYQWTLKLYHPLTLLTAQ